LILFDKSWLVNRVELPFKNGLKAIIRGENMRKVIDSQMKFGANIQLLSVQSTPWKIMV